MKIADLKARPLAAINLEDGKEAIVDALLNLTWQRASGAGPEGDLVFAVRPSLRFVSGFLMPRFEETGQLDETSDIHISTHGLDLQITADAKGEFTVAAECAIYVRALPSWEELTLPQHALFPNHPLRRDVDVAIRDEMKRLLSEALAAQEANPADQRRSHADLQQEIYRRLLAQHGVEVAPEVKVVAAGNAPDQSEEAADDSTDNEGDDTERLVAQRGRYVFHNDASAQPIDIPQKWKRLPVRLPVLRAELSDIAGVQRAVSAWTAQARDAIIKTVADWIGTPEGQNLAYRPSDILPSHVQSHTSWQKFLSNLRAAPANVKTLAPDLSGVSLSVQFDTDLKDPQRRNLRVMLENNSNAVRKRMRHRFDPCIHQVRLSVSLPTRAHLALKLDRVEPSYRFRDFLTYPAIGINCGVEESRERDRLQLMTTWMPRYTQPRIVPTVVKDVPTDFLSLGADGFDPAVLHPLVDAYRRWIDHEKNYLDPAAGVEDEDHAEKEKERFSRDLASYTREADRIALGIKLLEHAFERFRAEPGCREALPYRAWQLLNRAFQDAGETRGVVNWRLFQLTFILAHLPTLVSRMPEYATTPWYDHDFDEDTATLLYFPTGGGKSEAFFGLLIFNIFFDRLRGKLVGVTALIRYPLRLLTLQQAQRLLSLLVRAELLRKKMSVPGAPLEIGFWVGNANTPNKSDDPRFDSVPDANDPSHPDDENLGRDYTEANQSFNKIPRCPVCSQTTGLRRIRTGTDPEIGIYCFNRECRWNADTGGSPLPFLITDRDIYRHAPAVLLGVIDKLALIGQHTATIGRVMGMFGFARWRETSTGRFVTPSRLQLRDGPAANHCEAVAPAYRDGAEVFCDPFPSLIIQDEAHLLEESLGTFAGLFETTLEQLFVRGAALLGSRMARSPLADKPARLPKVIAATATVSVPQHQFGSLYQRKHMHFPYPGTSIYRSFYAAPALPSNMARRGIAGDVPRSPEIEAPWMRVYASIMTNGRNHTVTTVGVLAAYHLAVTELWEDLLTGGSTERVTQRIVASLTPTSPLRQFHVQAVSQCAERGPELLLTLLDLMRISLTYVTNKKGGDQVIDAFTDEVAKVHKRHGRHIEQFLTRLISGGIDVAEIQDIMRQADGDAAAGDDFVDLGQALRNIVATSAISHGVDVDKFNAMFFAGMPNDIAEFIQASSRIGRAHVGFSLLIPTPHARRDRYIIETHDVFHRFLERMIAPPAITRWAASAHDRVLTSLFQAWLTGWIEQELFVKEDDKSRALRFDTVNDVNRLLTGHQVPNASKDFMDFCVRAIGIPGRGESRVGAAPHPSYYDDRIRNLAKRLTDVFRSENATTRLADYWENSPVGQKPMTSLRDIDEAGRFVPARAFGRPRPRGNIDDKSLVTNALRIVRRQRSAAGELDGEDGDA
jgi:hypothetical protein